jgi:hypothetical protein
MTRRLLGGVGIVPLFEPIDIGAAAADSETILVGNASLISIILQFGNITADNTLILYAGATAGAKTTGLAFTYRVSGADYKAIAADQYGADVAVAATGLVLTAASFDHRTMVIDLADADMPAGQPWLTANLDGSATVQLVAGVALMGGLRYAPAASMVPAS